MSDYLLIRCVGTGNLINAKVARVIRIAEMRSTVDSDPEIKWGLDPRGRIPVKNSDGTVSVMDQGEGFFFSDEATPTFVLCYEYYDGICIHYYGDDRTRQKVFNIAQHMRAQLFDM